MELELAGRVAVVTGGASGIGWACARSLSREGCNVALWDQSTEVKKAANVLAREFSGSSLGIAVDVCDFAAVKEAVRQTETGLGPICHVVHAAATGSGRFGYPFTNLEPADWPRVLQVNMLGMVTRRPCGHAWNDLAKRWNACLSGLGRRANRFPDRSPLQREQSGQHQLCAVHGEGSGAVWNSRQCCESGYGANAVKRARLESVERSTAHREGGRTKSGRTIRCGPLHRLPDGRSLRMWPTW